jgi:hypothetical protein
MFNIFRRLKAAVMEFFGWREATPPTQDPKPETKTVEMKATATPEPETGIAQMVRNAYRNANELAGAIMLPDKIGQAYAKVSKAGHQAKWAVSHPKLALAKAHGFCASLWHAGAAWVAKAAACISAPGVIAAVGVVLVAGICVAAMMHGGPAT